MDKSLSRPVATNLSQLAETLPISVVIPCYRCGKTIQRAINSLARQTAIPAEIILIDDFSNDGTLEQLQSLSRLYPEGWVKIASLSCNGGPGVARNEGMRQATQPYVAFLDADDSWHPGKANIQYEWMRTHPEIMLTGHPSVKYSAQAEARNFSINCREKIILPSRLLLSNVFSSRSIMFRRELPIFFDSQKRYMEDQWWLMQIAFSGYSIVELKIPLSFTYKADYGESGLSNKLWQMERSELDNYWQLGRAGKISKLLVLLLWIYSLLKYMKRVLVSQWRRISSAEQ